MVVVPCRRLWDPRSSRLRRGPSRSPRRHPRDPHSSKKSRGSTNGHTLLLGTHTWLGQSPPGTPGQVQDLQDHLRDLQEHLQDLS